MVACTLLANEGFHLLIEWLQMFVCQSLCVGLQTSAKIKHRQYTIDVVVGFVLNSLRVGHDGTIYALRRLGRQ